MMIDRNNKNEPCENSRSLNAVPLSDNAKVNRGHKGRKFFEGVFIFFICREVLMQMRSTTMSNIIVTSLLLLVVFAAVVAVTSAGSATHQQVGAPICETLVPYSYDSGLVNGNNGNTNAMFGQ